VAVFAFAAFAAMSGYLTFLDDRLTSEQANLTAAALKSHDRNLFAGDSFMSHGQAWRFHSPGFRGLVQGLLAIRSYKDGAFPFRILAGPMVMLYLCGVYALLRSQCKSWSISAFVTILSAAAAPGLGEAFWGAGSLASVTPAGLCVCLTPPIILAFLLWREYRLRLLVFLVAGAMGNIHMAAAMNLVIALAAAHLIERRLELTAWPATVGLGLAAVIGASPCLVYYLHLAAAEPTRAPQDMAMVKQALRTGELAVLYPEVLRGAAGWLARAAALAVPAAIVLTQVPRFRPRNGLFWISLAAAALVTALGLQAVSQLIGAAADMPPPVIDFCRASALVMLPLYVLFAQAVTGVFRLIRSHRALLQAVCAAVLAAWMIPSDNMRVARRGVYELATAFMSEEDRPRRVHKLHEQRLENQELSAIARWSAENTPPGAVFLTDRPEFRALARRGIVAGDADGPCLYYADPARLGRWFQRLQKQSALLHPPTGKLGGKDICAFLAELAKQGDVQESGPWYVIVPGRVALEGQGCLVIETSEVWGRHYRLCRVVPPPG
jgi:hypothetical protein